MKRYLVLAVSLMALACVANPSRTLTPDSAADVVAHAPRPVYHMPPPTENWLAEDAESTNKQRRKVWMRERHRSAPDVDWKTMELANGKAQRIKRNQLAQEAAGGASLWTEIGSRNQAGRIHVASLSPDEVTLYAGSSKGGIWKGNLSGVGWTPIGDNLYGGAHWLATIEGAQPSDPPIVVAATDGGEIHRTTDDGLTWTIPSGLPSTITNVRRVFRSTDGSNYVFIVLRGLESGYRYGLWRSTNNGASFSKVLDMASFSGDAWGPRDGAGPIFALRSDGTYRSDDNGSSFLKVAELPTAASGGELTGSEAGAPDLYAVFDTAADELWHSDDAGGTWTYRKTITDYWGTLAASIVNPDLVAYGGVETWRSYNEGANFTKVNNWYDYYNNVGSKLHADTPGLDVWPIGPNGEAWYISTDGGLYRSLNNLSTVFNLSLDGLGVSQYYTTLTSTTNVDHILAGAQDQGWQRADVPAQGGGSTVDFDQMISGDYGHAVSGDHTHKFVYTVYPGFMLIHIGETNSQLVQENFPSGESYSWLPALAADPDDNGSVFFCATRLWRYEKVVGVNDWTATLWSTHNFALSGGEYLTGLSFSPVNSNRAYAVTNFGRLWYSSDKGLTWTQSSTTGPSGQYFYGTAILASATDIDTVLVGGSGYGSPAVWRSTNGGQSFSAYNTGLPNTLVYCLGESSDNNGTLVCGTETGVYRRDLNAASWTDITENDAPVTTYWSVESVAELDVMRFGTYGRGIWDYDLTPEGVYSPYGLALKGSNTVSLDSISASSIGTPHQIHSSGAPPQSVGILAFSTQETFLPALGGTSLLSGTNFKYWLITSNASGEHTRTLNIPDDNTLIGVPLHFQSVFSDLSEPLGWALSNGLRAILVP